MQHREKKLNQYHYAYIYFTLTVLYYQLQILPCSNHWSGSKENKIYTEPWQREEQHQWPHIISVFTCTQVTRLKSVFSRSWYLNGHVPQVLIMCRKKSADTRRPTTVSRQEQLVERGDGASFLNQIQLRLKPAQSKKITFLFPVCVSVHSQEDLLCLYS